jgi:hypothetical protein
MMPVTKKVNAAVKGVSCFIASNTKAKIVPREMTKLRSILHKKMFKMNVIDASKGIKKMRIWNVEASGQDFGGST